jgi:hypothetical protein
MKTRKAARCAPHAKVMYKTQKEAEAGMMQARASLPQGGGIFGYPRRVYFDPVCQCYHLSSGRPKTRKPRSKGKIRR